MTDDAVLVEMRALRDQVIGVTDTLVASADGLVIAADTEEVDPNGMAALAAATLGIARRTSQAAGKGALREAITRCSGGYIAVYAVGGDALLVVLADEGLNVARLHLESRSAVEEISALLSAADRDRT